MSRACVTEPDVRGAGGSRAPQLGGRRSMWDVTRLPSQGNGHFPQNPGYAHAHARFTRVTE